MGLAFFFLMIVDSHIERRVAVPSTLGIPRWHKRVAYYVFKIRYLQNSNKYMMNLPNMQIRKFLSESYFNEYESYEENL
jgi:hypothetical protein